VAALRELLVAFGIEVNTKPLTDAEKKTDAFKDKLGQVAGALGAAFALTKVVDFVSGMISAGDAVGDQAARLNLSTKALEEWTYQAKFADIEANELNGIFDKLARTSAAAGEAGSEQSKTLKKLGVDVKDTNGHLKDTSTLFEEVGLALSGVDDETKRTALSFEFFGKTAGPKVLQLFKDGPAGIAKFRAEFEELGGGFGDFVEAAGEVDDQMHRMDLAWLSAKTRIASVVMPAVLWLVQGLTRLASFFSKLAKETNLVQAGLITLGAVAVALGIKVLAAWGPVLLVSAAWGAAIALVALALDDVITFFQGGDSVIGRAIDAWFGDGSQEKVRAWASAIVDAVGPFVKGAIKGAMDLVLSVANLIGMALTDDAKRMDELGSSFFKNSASMVNAIDSVIDRLSVLKDMFNWDTFKTGVADALDVVDNAVSKVTGLPTRRDIELGTVHEGTGPRREGPLNAESIRSAFIPTPATISGPAAPFFAPAGGGVNVRVDNKTIVNVPPGTPASMVRAVSEAASRGSSSGHNRAAAAAFDKRGK
jgi:hypothetical protein